MGDVTVSGQGNAIAPERPARTDCFSLTAQLVQAQESDSTGMLSTAKPSEQAPENDCGDNNTNERMV
jgi:hypothetical protein